MDGENQKVNTRHRKIKKQCVYERHIFYNSLQEINTFDYLYLLISSENSINVDILTASLISRITATNIDIFEKIDAANLQKQMKF